MTALLAIALLAAPAFAQDDPDTGNRDRVLGTAPVPEKPWRVDPYWEPVSELRALFIKDSINGIPSIQLAGGVGGGVRYKFNGEPHWFGYTRGQGTLTYSITYGGLGLDGRLGTFFGVDDDHYRVTTGPDFFYDLYQGGDYFLRAAPGLGWNVTATAKPLRELWLVGSFTPAWVFHQQRKRPGAAFDEFTVRLDAKYFGEFRLSVGWLFMWNIEGHFHGPVISAQL